MSQSQNQQSTGRAEKAAFCGKSQRGKLGELCGKHTHGKGRHSARDNPLRGNFPGQGKEEKLGSFHGLHAGLHAVRARHGSAYSESGQCSDVMR